MDLVDEADRDAKVRYINAHGDHIAGILAVGMMQEGADWPACARVIDLVPSASDQVRNQRSGRLVRDHPGKDHVHYYSFFPYLLDRTEEARRAGFSRLFAHFHASLVLENTLDPIRVPARQRRGGGGRSVRSVVRQERADLLGCFDGPMQRRIEKEVGRALLDLAASQASPPTWEEVGTTILGVLDRLGCAAVIGDGNLGPLRDQIVLLWRRRWEPDLDLASLLGAGFDKVWAPEALDPLKVFSAGTCGVTTFEELRQLTGSSGPHSEAEA